MDQAGRRLDNCSRRPVGCSHPNRWLRCGKGIPMGIKKVRTKNGHSYYYDFQIRKVRYRGVIPEAQNKAQALEVERQIKNQVFEGKYGCALEDPTVAEFVDEHYWDWAGATKPRSIKMDRYRIKPILDYFGQMKLSEISTFLIEKYRLERLRLPIVYKRDSRDGEGTQTWEKSRSASSVNREVYLLSSIFRLAVADKKMAVSENPCRGVSLPKEQARTRYMSPDEEERLLDVLTGPRAHLLSIVELYLTTGMRENELLRLPVGLVDLNRDVVYLKNTKGEIDHEVPLSSRSREILAHLVNRARRIGWHFIFTNPETGKPYTTIKTAWRTACRLAGIRDLRIHDLRHTFGTRAADAGVPLSAIRNVMGHNSIKMTERYAHATDEGMR